MRRARVILLTLLSHWRRRPFQLLTLMVGLAVATALWSGVQALNMQARESYDAAVRTLGGDRRLLLLPTVGDTIAQADYVALRRAGWPVSPVLEGNMSIGGSSYRLIGVDIVTSPPDLRGFGDGTGREEGRLVDLLVPPSLTLAEPGLVAALGGKGARPRSDAGRRLPPLVPEAGMAAETLVTDIGVAQDLLDLEGEISRLVVTGEVRNVPPLESVTGERLRRLEPTEEGDLQRLTDSFHLNLAAFGLLAFLVGLFIVHSAVGLAFEQRRSTMRTMRACGVSARALAAAMLAETVALAALAGLIGVILGYLIASALLPDVAASLRGLYGARVSGELEVRPVWWMAGIAISVVGALAASGGSLVTAWRLPLFATAQPHAWATAQAQGLRRQAVAALLLAALAAALLLFGRGLVAGFALMGATLLAAALLLPAMLAGLLRRGELRAGTAVGQWIFADARQQLGGLSLALMALLLALAVNVGVSTMVDSFRLTFTGWLDQRLAAELYVGATDDAQAREISRWLGEQEGVAAVLPVWHADTRYRGFPVEVYGFRDHRTYSENWPLIAAAPDVWQETAAGRAALVSEQMARRFDLSVGDRLTIPTPAGEWPVAVGAIYTDYGNPRGQIMVNLDELTPRFPDAERDDFAVRAAPGAVAGLMDALRRRFDDAPPEIVDQASLKEFSQRVFERTFAVTLALNTLTLIVAGIALLSSLLTLSSSRLPQLAPIWALGVTRRRLAALELAKAMVLAALTAVVALPLGLVVAWILMNVVNVEAFGWRLPFHLFPGQWLRLFLLAMLTALISAGWPALALRRMPPATLLKAFADER